MSTHADEHRDAALEHVREAIAHLNHIVVLECWGADDYKSEYRVALMDAMIGLIQIKEKL